MSNATNYLAHRANGAFALIPNAVADDQKGFDASRKSFLPIPADNCGRPTGAKPFRAILRGDLYGLHTTGTGDLTISNA